MSLGQGQGRAVVNCGLPRSGALPTDKGRGGREWRCQGFTQWLLQVALCMRQSEGERSLISAYSTTKSRDKFTRSRPCTVRRDVRRKQPYCVANGASAVWPDCTKSIHFASRPALPSLRRSLRGPQRHVQCIQCRQTTTWFPEKNAWQSHCVRPLRCGSN